MALSLEQGSALSRFIIHMQSSQIFSVFSALFWALSLDLRYVLNEKKVKTSQEKLGSEQAMRFYLGVWP